jgi:hypothetical protein
MRDPSVFSIFSKIFEQGITGQGECCRQEVRGITTPWTGKNKKIHKDLPYDLPKIFETFI